MDTTVVKHAPVEVSLGEEELRIAVLTARTGLEPELARRYEHSPAVVLTEFGLSARQLAPARTSVVVIEDLSRSAAGAMAIPTWTTVGPGPEEPDAPAAAAR